LKPLLYIVAFTIFLAGESVCAQSTNDDKSNPAISKSTLDFSNDPCGSPLVESQLWELLEGKIETVKDNRTLLVVLPKENRRLHIQLAGIALDRKSTSADQAKAELTKLGLNQLVEIPVNPDLHENTQNQVFGVVQLKKGSSNNLALILLRKGLAHTEKPAPYTISAYTFCQYRHAENDAQNKKTGT